MGHGPMPHIRSVMLSRLTDCWYVKYARVLYRTSQRHIRVYCNTCRPVCLFIRHRCIQPQQTSSLRLGILGVGLYTFPSLLHRR